MKNQKGLAPNLIVITIALILLLILGTYYFQKQKSQSSLSPEEVVRAFYLDYSKSYKEDLLDYQNSPYLTKNFIVKADEFFNSSDNLNYDPFICSQEFLKDDYELRVIDSSEEKRTIMVENRFNIFLTLIDKNWLIDDIDCYIENIVEDIVEDIVFQPENQSEENYSEESKEIIENNNNNLYNQLSPDVKNFVDRAILDLSQHLLISSEDIVVQEVLPAVFSDHTLGTSKPGEVYPQTPVSGYVIILFSKGANYKYHVSETQVLLVQ